jgi:hypothetical protein
MMPREKEIVGTFCTAYAVLAGTGMMQQREIKDDRAGAGGCVSCVGIVRSSRWLGERSLSSDLMATSALGAKRKIRARAENAGRPSAAVML